MKEVNFDIREAMKDKQFRARVILVFYAILFIILIVAIRSAPKKTLDNTQNNNQAVENNIVETPDTNTVENITPTQPEEDIFTGYSLAMQKNFSFEYHLVLSGDESFKYTSSGKQYNDKQAYTVKSANEKIEFLVDGSDIRGRSSTDEEYILMSAPILYVDYFNVELINKLLLKSKLGEKDNELKITNIEMCEVIGCDAELMDQNTITLTKKNKNITELTIDYSNLCNELSKKSSQVEFSTAKITLKYSDFSLIDDFELKYK